MKVLIALLMSLLIVGTAAATTFDGQIVEVSNNGATYVVKVQIKVDATAGLGGATLAFTFNTSDLSYPASPTAGVDYAFAAYNSGLYTASVTRPLASKVSINIEYNGSTGGATNVNTTYTDVATITFTVVNAAGSSNLTWVKHEALADDAMTPWTEGSFTGLNSNPLPVQVASFTAALLQESKSVQLKWSTASETNNYGFEVQKASEPKGEYQTIQGSFIAGHGTTVESHSYSYTDANANTGSSYYRLKQTDLDGTIHYSEAVSATLTGVESKPLPTTFALDQNYPNPFNPSTTIEFQLPKESKVTLEVYNVIGQRIALLVDEVRPAGYYAMRFDGTQLGSGVYFYRFSTPEFSYVRKMLLTK
jgi:hypothetical protein